MRQFIKFTFASCLGVFIAMGAMFVFLLLIAIGATMSGKPADISGSVLYINPQDITPEHTNNVPRPYFELHFEDILGIQDIVAQIDRAVDDPGITGIYLNASEWGLGQANAKVVHSALQRFRESGKFVLAYSSYYGQLNYYLATAADTIILNPIGSVDFRGFAAFVPFFKDLMDKTSMKMQIYYAGDFKSASEPFRRRDMSEENKLQTRAFLDAAYDQFLTDISESRNIPKERLREIADGLLSTNSDDARTLGLVDVIGHEDQAMEWLRDRLDLPDDAKPGLVGLQSYYSTWTGHGGSGSDRIAVVYAEGEMLHGETDYGSIGDQRYMEVLRDLRTNSRVKAVVLRINSPGGNILAADNILREVRLLQEAGKPVVVSMSDYAASGGYYVACTADSIFAEPNTLTGSIGVVSIIPNPHALLSEKLGVTFDTVRTGTYSAAFSPVFAWSEAEDRYFEKRTEDYYQLFLRHVADGRNMTIDEVHAVAQGRIWAGEKAYELGLVDALGGLPDAVEAAAALAQIEEYRISEYPHVPNPINRLISQITGQDIEASADAYLENRLSREIPNYAAIRNLLFSKEPLARLPVVLKY